MNKIYSLFLLETMKKILILFVLLCAVGVHSASSQEVHISYDETYKLDPFQRQLLEFQNISFMKIVLRSEFNGKRVKLTSVKCHNGEFTKKDLTPKELKLIFPDSIETINVFTENISDGNIRVSGYFPFRFVNDTICSPKDNTILMETLSDKPYTQNDSIPIFAVSRGIDKHSEKMGKYIDYCGLRYANTNPIEWYSKFGINDYYYLVISFCDSNIGDETESSITIKK